LPVLLRPPLGSAAAEALRGLAAFLAFQVARDDGQAIFLRKVGHSPNTTLPQPEDIDGRRSCANAKRRTQAALYGVW
jgi:hypothetical protein